MIVFIANPHVYSFWSFVIVFIITFAGPAFQDIADEKNVEHLSLTSLSVAGFEP